MIVEMEMNSQMNYFDNNMQVQIYIVLDNLWSLLCDICTLKIQNFVFLYILLFFSWDFDFWGSFAKHTNHPMTK